MNNQYPAINKELGIFNKLLMIARPAAGKSEIIHYLKIVPDEKRREKFHIGKVHVIDDFPFLWRWFEEDSLLSRMGKPRLYTNEDGYFKKRHFWHLLIRMMNLEFEKFIRDTNQTDTFTVILEFSRGKEHGGYQDAFIHIQNEIRDLLPILYMDVSWEESLRKNRARFNPDRPDSILQHALPDKKMKRLYYETDFFDLAETKSEDENLISINDTKMPFAVFENNDDVTTEPGPDLDRRLEVCLEDLWIKTTSAFQV